MKLEQTVLIVRVQILTKVVSNFHNFEIAANVCVCVCDFFKSKPFITRILQPFTIS